LSSTYTSKRVTIVISKTLESFSINSNLVRYFTLNNITNNNTIVTALSNVYSFFLKD
ncbi:hypothetical protein K458DRAFT_323793, partial [Lentithecium fluviatile CBS 122367]